MSIIRLSLSGPCACCNETKSPLFEMSDEKTRVCEPCLDAAAHREITRRKAADVWKRDVNGHGPIERGMRISLTDKGRAAMRLPRSPSNPLGYADEGELAMTAAIVREGKS